MPVLRIIEPVSQRSNSAQELLTAVDEGGLFLSPSPRGVDENIEAGHLTKALKEFADGYV